MNGPGLAAAAGDSQPGAGSGPVGSAPVGTATVGAATVGAAPANTVGAAPIGAGALGGAGIAVAGAGAAGSVAKSVFGPSALATPANGITVVRLLAAPILMIMVLNRPSSWLTMSVWTVLAGTDGIDGWLARRHGTTRSGAFLDPLADKFLVLGAMFALVSVERFPLLPVALIAGRELVISVYRVVVARQGISVPARPLAKAKTVVQSLAVGAALLPAIGDDHRAIALTLLWLAVGLTLITGLQYLLDGKRSGATNGAGPAAGTASV